MEVTYPQILTFRQNARQYLLESGTKNNHLVYALNRILEYDYTEKHERRYKRECDDARVDHALIKDGCFVRDKANQIEIDPAKFKKYAEVMDKLNTKKIEVEQVLAKTLPEDLSIAHYHVFVPFVIESFPNPDEDDD